MNIENSQSETQNLPLCARQGALKLAKSKASDRCAALKAMANAIQRHQNDILEANTLDLEASRMASAREPMLDWLKLTPARLETTVEILQQLANLPDPIGRIINPANGRENGHTYFQRIPVGAIALIYEVFPELAAIAAGMCVKTANSLLLLGVSEATHSNLAIVQALSSALEEVGMPWECVQLLPLSGEDSVRNLVTQDQYLSLVIPYGGPSLVQKVVEEATIPVLRTAMGNCYLYWSASGSLETARSMILESHQNQPDPVNAIEKVLIAPNQKSASLVRLWNILKEKGFEIRVDEALHEDFPDFNLAERSEWGRPYLTKTVAFKAVENLDTAIAWINCYSSGHADCLATESYQESRQFALEINSASTFINDSPRFYRSRQPGDTIFLGMSNQKNYPRGPISLETLTTIKQIFLGNK